MLRHNGLISCKWYGMKMVMTSPFPITGTLLSMNKLPLSDNAMNIIENGI